MAYLSLYRKWRPQSFDQMVGQEVPVNLLTRSLSQGRIHHAYLFSGPRGVGKTTTARILAMALNCEQGVTSSPCGSCGNCRAIRGGNSLDVVEIDAASHRGIDDIRDLREKAKYAPLQSRYKVYIIDEVHMLTTEAFNALLKTLEEPPSKVVFILATTDPQRLPETILSRCLRLNFAPVEPDLMVDRLRYIAKEEGFMVEEEALYLIAQKAGGSLRDAEGFLEQVIGWGEKEVAVDLVSRVLRELDTSQLDQLFDLARAGERGKTLAKLNEWIEAGLSPEDINRSLINYFRSLLVFILSEGKKVGEFSPLRREKLKTLTQNLSFRLIRECLEKAQSVEFRIRRSFQPRVLLELGILDIIDCLGEAAKKKQPAREEKEVLVDNLPEKEEEVKIDAQPEPEIEPQEEPKKNGGPAEETNHYWEKVLAEIKKEKISLYAFLQAAEWREAGPSKWVLAFAPECQFHKESVERRDNLLLLRETIKKIRGSECSLECILDQTVISKESDSQEAPPVSEEKKVNPVLAYKDEVGGNNVVSQVVEMFSGVLVDYLVKEGTWKGGWNDAELEKPHEGSPEDAG
ncbi:MAG: polymerase subunit gamma/tau [Candidatus Atribacteria bacterium]|nr:polymerase subunit gamma/tau [Candidatus Atribacteria bacterium]